MGLNTYPSNPFPPSTDRMDADALEAEVNQLKSGLTNVNATLATAGTVTQPTASSIVTITSGGYAIIGKMVIVDMQFTVTDTVSGAAVVLFSGLPSPGKVNIPLTLSDTQANVITSTCRIYNGSIYSGVAMAIGDNRSITGCYLAS